MTDRDEIVLRRRRQEALDSLAFEQEREEALRTRLESAIRDLEGWRADEVAFAAMAAEAVDLLTRTGFARKRPGDDSRVRLESQIAELEAQVADSRRRQRAFESYAEALAGGPGAGVPETSSNEESA